MSVFSAPLMHQPATIDAAVALLAEGDAGRAPLAGSTWIMRAPLRHETLRPAYVCLAGIAALRSIAISETSVEFGAMVTHAKLAEAVAACPDLTALAEAGGRSANPAVRAAATIGGNLCTPGFPAADLLPAFMSHDALVELARPDGTERLCLERFLEVRATLAPGWLLTRIIVPRSGKRSAHMRLPLRKAGDYPVSIVSLAVSLGADDRVAEARVAIGSAEPMARRWRSLEARLIGGPLDPARAQAEAESLLGEFTGRDGVEAPGWYRVHVLPVLVRRAVAAVAAPLSSGIASPCRSA